jgi:hypothetical protein
MTTQPVDRKNLFSFRADKSSIYILGLAYGSMAVIFIAVHLRLSQFAFDDAYIHFRVARNLLDLGTPYFNTNEMVKVSTSSGWTVFVAVLMALSRSFGIEKDFRIFVSLANASLTLAGMFVYSAVIERILERQSSGVSKVLFQVTYLAFLAGASVGLMEIPLALLLAGLGILTITKSRTSGFFWLGLAAYVRLELVILLLIIGLYQAIEEKSRIWRIFLFSTLGILPFLAYDLYFFHTILPHSIVAKSVVYSIASLQTFTRSLLLAIPLIVSQNQSSYFIIAFLLFTSLIFSMAVTLVLNRRSNARDWILVFSLSALVIFFTYVAGHALIFEWYTPLYTVPALLAVTLSTNKSLFPRNGLATGIQLAFFVSSLVVLFQFSIAAFIDRGQFIQFESGSRVKTYLEVGKILNTEYPGAVLLSSEIGGLGYAFRGRVIDAAGLAAPDALEFHPMRVPEERSRGDLGAIPPLYVEKQMPDVIVSYDQFAQALLASKVMDQYNVVPVPAYLPEDRKNAKTDTIWGDRYLRIYIRKDLPVSKEILNLGIN